MRNSPSLQELYWEALQREWALRQPGESLTLYFGGGTPSLLDPERVAQILSWLPNRPEEITLEMNPEDCTPARLAGFRAAGINRLSMGVQTFDDALLRPLNRLHSAAQAEEAVWQAAAAGFENISIDLMYDLPNQSIESWQASLDRAVQLPIAHVSLYNLVLEPGSLFHKRPPQQPDEATSLAMWDATQETLSAAQFDHYALSAFTRGNRPSQHNLGYWTGRPFLGLGPSAWSYVDGRRFQNAPDLQLYAQKLQQGQDPTTSEETLSPEAQQREQLILLLRLAEGSPRIPVDAATLSALSQLESAELLISTPSHWRLTPRGMRVFDSVAAALV